MSVRRILIPVLFSFSFIVINAHERRDTSLKICRNYLIVNLSFLDANFNYERNIVQLPKSYTNIRIGFGVFNDLQGGGNECIATLVHLIGRKKSHLEINLGIKYFVNSKNNSNPSSDYFMRDVFLGYRYEKPDGPFIFRIGYYYPHIYAFGIGLGFKF